MFALLSLWRRVVRLIRSIGLAISNGTKIIWSKKIREATDIANDYLDHQGHPKLDDRPASKPKTRRRWRKR